MDNGRDGQLPAHCQLSIASVSTKTIPLYNISPRQGFVRLSDVASRSYRFALDFGFVVA